eukprot:gnl/MRDRNA2_/MRDRNA2_25802_c0_seq1.p1 gnl/MRDRNA2_/MRDRNA2_25802_c0~~gnl/MRDRNA2_/MRDRNA2_25802_c0_seq1.p1  ORF type:complete len:582 (-),score=97.81 gnl/MRDRNA2_/MRDRNA2_25802_c0_seq1:2-1540(-)
MQVSNSDVEVVQLWLQSMPHPAQMWLTPGRIDASATVSAWEQLLQTELGIFVHSDGSRVIRCCRTYWLPTAVYDVLDFWLGLADFPPEKSHVPVHIAQQKAPMVVPQTLAYQYNYTASKLIHTKVRQLVGECDAFYPDGGSFLPSDLRTFYAELDLPRQTVAHVSGSGNKSVAGIEGSLDVQYITSVGLGADNWYVTTPKWIYTLVATIGALSDAHLPHVVSMSFGWPEAQECDSAKPVCKSLHWKSRQYVTRSNIELMKLGLRGVSVFAASGDYGSGGGHPLSPGFPASSPYVTAVGATQLTSVKQFLKSPKLCSGNKRRCAHSGHEIASKQFASGGGFSNFSARPSFQQKAVETFLQRSAGKLPHKGCFNASGRAMPDVAALGVNFLVDQAKTWQSVGGTSASTPTWAGMASRMVEVSLKKTGKALGNLNPLLYQMVSEKQEVFTDVVSGSNVVPGSCTGFYAIPGWDPVTGLGTPNLGHILDYLEVKLGKHSSSAQIFVYSALISFSSV